MCQAPKLFNYGRMEIFIIGDQTYSNGIVDNTESI